MENSIVRGAIQGLIDDSKLVDKIATKLDCHRTEILDKIEDNFALKNEPIATIEEIKQVIHAVEKAETGINDARYSAEEAKDQADNAVNECDNADSYIGDAKSITDNWGADIKKLEETEVDADAEVEKKAPAQKSADRLTEEQKEIDNSNQYAVTNN